MSMYGADVAELRSLAAQFDRTADQLDANRMTVGNAIQISAWVGPFATQFRLQWDSEHSRRIHVAAELLRSGARALRSNADDQERASAVDGSLGGHPGSTPPLSGRASDGFGSIVHGVTEVVNGVINGADIANNIDDVVETMRGAGGGIIDNLPGGKYLAASLKGVGLGDALAGLAEGIRDGDASGAMSSAADGLFTFASAPIGLLWSGLKAETNFFIPLDQASQSEHLSWMQSQGYSPQEVSERYSGVQGFINLGNDNVERKAPWLNDIADKVMEKPAEWLYNMGIRIG